MKPWLMLTTIFIFLCLTFQNCSRTNFALDSNALNQAPGKSGEVRDGGDDGLINPEDEGDDGATGRMPEDEGDDGAAGRDPEDEGDDSNSPDDEESDVAEDDDWLYIPGGRGHVHMSAVAICPAGSKDEGKQKCPMFCYQGVDYIKHKSEARNYFRKKFDEVPYYGDGAVPGTCAVPNLMIKD